MLICPSILEYKAEDYFTTIKKLSSFYKYFQIDFSDGVYVDSKTASLDDFMNLITLQTLKTLVFDFHFMVKNYEEHIKKIEAIKKIVKIKNVFIHYDLVKEIPRPDYIGARNDKVRDFSIGLVLNPQDQVDDLADKYPLNNIPAIQIMSIVPGAQGKPFLPETLNKIEQLRNLGYRNEIFLDGAVNDKTMPIIAALKYQPDFVCPGSYLTKTDNLKDHVDYLLQFT